MPVNYGWSPGSDLPSWVQLPWAQVASQPGTSRVYDGSRFVYWIIQSGSTSAASTTQLWRFDTVTGEWRFLVTLTSGFNGIDIDLDPIRNVLIFCHGNSLTEWRYFNLNGQAITFLGQTVAAMTLSAAITPVLPAATNVGASIIAPNELDVPGVSVAGAPAGPLLTGAISLTTAPTATTLRADAGAGREINPGLVGCNIRFTSGAQAGQVRTITAVALTLPAIGDLTAGTGAFVTVTFGALPGAPAVGDTFVIEVVGGTFTAGAAGTATDANKAWPVNLFANCDALIVSGTGAGQRRRIASNTATVLTLAAAVPGNPRTGNWATAPDATSVYQIVPSSDFYYYAPGNAGTGFNKIDVMATTLAWVATAAFPAAVSGGSDLHTGRDVAPYSLFAFRGNASGTLYRYDIGLNAWVTIATLFASETLTTGATSTSIMPGRRRMAIFVAGWRLYMVNIAWGTLEPLPPAPYASASAFDGKRLTYIKTAAGVEWLYYLRAGGQEFFRLPMEWL